MTTDTTLIPSQKTADEETIFNTSGIISAPLTKPVTMVQAGMGLTESGAPDLNLTIAAGTFWIAGKLKEYAGAAVASSAASGANPRIDIISISAAGTVTVTAGTAAALPVTPAMPAGECPLALIYRPTSDDTITDDNITHYNSAIVTSQTGEWVRVGYADRTAVDPLIILLPADFVEYKLPYRLNTTGDTFESFRMRSNGSATAGYRWLSPDAYVNTSTSWYLWGATNDAFRVLFGEIGLLNDPTNSQVLITHTGGVNSYVFVDDYVMSGDATHADHFPASLLEFEAFINAGTTTHFTGRIEIYARRST